MLKSRRLHVLVDEDQYHRLEAAAARRKVPVAVVVREALDEKLRSAPEARRKAAETILSAAPMPVGNPAELGKSSRPCAVVADNRRDTAILIHAVDADHPLVEPCRELVRLISRGEVRGTTTPEVIQGPRTCAPAGGPRGAIRVASDFATNHTWLFAAGLTDVSVDITVSDHLTNRQRHYQSPIGWPLQAITDTQAFASH